MYTRQASFRLLKSVNYSACGYKSHLIHAPLAIGPSANKNLSDIGSRIRVAFLSSVALTKKDKILLETSKLLYDTLEKTDPELTELIKKEKDRQIRVLDLIASENFTSLAVLDCLSSCSHNKYSEGLVGKRYIGGSQFIDEIEILAQKRALEAYNLNPDVWGVNVQPYSGSPANLAVYTALCQPHDRIMGLDLEDGGHVTHGCMTVRRKFSATSKFFETMSYKVDPRSGLIDYDELERCAKLFKPRVIIAGVSCYPRCLDYARFRKIADDNEAYLFADMAHISGLVAAGIIPSPFEFADVVSTTTHKTLRGPRAGVIFSKKNFRKTKPNGRTIMYNLARRINIAVSSGLQGGAHNNTIAGIATAMLQAKTTQFVKYQEQVVKNAQRLAKRLIEKGYSIATGGTDIHLLLVDLRPQGLIGATAEYILQQVSIDCNRSGVPGDTMPLNPSGLRLGTSALTTRGLLEEDIDQVVNFIDRGLVLCREVSNILGPKEYSNMTDRELDDVKIAIDSNANIRAKVNALRCEVETFSHQFPLPGRPDL